MSFTDSTGLTPWRRASSSTGTSSGAGGTGVGSLCSDDMITTSLVFSSAHDQGIYAPPECSPTTRGWPHEHRTHPSEGPRAPSRSLTGAGLAGRGEPGPGGQEGRRGG